MAGSFALSVLESPLSFIRLGRSAAIILLAVLLVAVRASGQGYLARPCGFDLNDNGIIGEPADCSICDAMLADGLIQGGTADPDGDGTDEDLIYVDCENGIDQATCGLAGNEPCRSIEYAFNTVADGSGDGAEDIVCFTGVCSTANSSAVDTIRIQVDGVPGQNTRPRTGNQERAFEYPSNPMMLMGWDRDADGSFPPFDPDDISIIDTPDIQKGFNVLPSYTEFAHFAWNNHSQTDNVDGIHAYLIKVSDGPARSHIYLHDIESDGTNRGNSLHATEIGINLFAHTGLTYFSIENSQFTNTGGYWLRGGTGRSPESGPFRFQNLTVTFMGCPLGADPPCDELYYAAVAVAKLWGWVTGQEWIDNVFDAQPDQWNSPGSAQTIGGGSVQCVQDVVYRNNRFFGFATGLNFASFAPGFCDTPPQARPVRGIVAERNEFTYAYGANPTAQGAIGIVVSGGGPLIENSVEDVTVVNNVFIDSSPGIRHGIEIRGGNNESPHVGRITITGNRFEFTNLGKAFIAIVDVDGNRFNRQDFVIRDNNFRVDSQGPGRNVDTEYAPTS